MAKGSIALSQKHGVNPSLLQCFVCMKDVGVALMGRLPGDAEAPRRICPDQAPCDECKKLMEQGIILISVDEKKTEDRNNPWRTGGWVVMKEEAFARIFGGDGTDFVDSVLKSRVCFVPDEIWDAVGLPRGDVLEQKLIHTDETLGEALDEIEKELTGKL